MEQRTKTLLLRRTILILLFLVSAIVQNCVLPFSGGGIRVWFLLPLTVITAMFEKETVGALCGLLAGCLWDCSAGSVDGIKALFFTLAGCICGLLIRYIMRNNLLSALALCGSVALAFLLLHWTVNVAMLSPPGSIRALFVFYLPQALLTELSVPVFYFLIRAVEKRFRLPGEAR